MARAASQFDDNKITVKKQWCKGCGICAALCGNKVLMLDSRGKAAVTNPAACTGCGRCEDHCPDMAITVDRPSQRGKFTAPGGYAKEEPATGYGATV